MMRKDRRPPRIAYLTGRYPAVSHTFVLREVQALRALGVGIDSFSIWRSGPEQLLSGAEVAENEGTYAMLPPSIRDYARSHLAAFLAHPLGYLRHLVGALRLSAAGSRGKFLALTWFLESIVLWRECLRREIRHIHVHMNGTAPAVALLTARFGNLDRREHWTFSMHVHGPAEFYDVVGDRLAEKVKEALFVVCISDFARSQLMVLLGESEWSKLEVVHCGVRTDGLPRMRSASVNGREPMVLSVGRLVSVKGQALMVEAVAELARRGEQAQMTIVGEGPNRPTLERLIADAGLSGRVELPGAIGQDGIMDYYSRADVFCLSSFAEGVPIVLMEAMAFGLPVVAPRIMGISELVDEGVNGVLVRPGRADELASALEKLIRDPNLRVRMGRAGREKVEEQFNLARSAEQLRDIFAERLEAG